MIQVDCRSVARYHWVADAVVGEDTFQALGKSRNLALSALIYVLCERIEELEAMKVPGELGDVE